MDSVQHNPYHSPSNTLSGALDERPTSTDSGHHHNPYGYHTPQPPPLASPPQQHPQPQQPQPIAPNGAEREEEEEMSDEDMGETDAAQTSASQVHHQPMQPNGTPTGATMQGPQIIQHEFVDGVQAVKRKPGRPKGSKTKVRRVDPQPITASTTTVAKSALKYPGFHQAPPALQHPQSNQPEINAHNQQYYEFQWRILNLCSEFYNAADELVNKTSPLVIAQSYAMGPGVVTDPINMLNEAKRNCDQLLSNPSQLVSRPPPPIFPPAPQWGLHAYGHYPPPPGPGVITNPQSFVLSFGQPNQHVAPAQPQAYPSSGYNPVVPRYPPQQYYQTGAPYTGYAYAPPPAQAPAAPAQTRASESASTAPSSSRPAATGGSDGGR